MPATFVTTAELRANLGIGSLYSDATVEECCQSAEDLIQQYLWHNDAPVVGTALQLSARVSTRSKRLFDYWSWLG